MILQRLRSETRAAHESLEQISGADKILNHSISLEEYSALLKSNYIAYAKAESQLAPLQNESIASWIQKDVQALEAELPRASGSNDQKSDTAKLGVQYVIEGSLLGGAMIAKHITQCPALKNLPVQQFYAAGSPDRTNRWREFVTMMNSKDLTEQESIEIIDVTAI